MRRFPVSILASLVLFIASFAMPSVASAAVVLTFEGLQDLEAVNDFYNGGTGGLGSVGPDFGIGFTTNSLAIVDEDAGGSGNFGGEPSPSTILFFLSGDAAIMNVAAGFDTGFSFFYSAINNSGVINVYSGLDGTGTLLASLNLPTTPHTGAPDPSGEFSPLVPIGVGFAGIAMSVDFGGTINQIGFDDVTIGSVTPGENGSGVPEPATLLLFGSGLAMAMQRRLRRTGRQS